MRAFHSASRRLAILACFHLPVLAAPAAGQLIPLRTEPIVRADGFEFLPSRQLAMGGVTIAFSDTLGDAWSNPAAAARLSGVHVFGSPVTYRVSGPAGGGGALPLGVIGRSGAWFGAGAVALQSVEPGRTSTSGGPIFIDELDVRGPELPQIIAEEGTSPAGTSRYAFGLLGRAWQERGLAIGGSVVAARRHAVDGIGLLYGESAGLDASGAMATFRLGLLAESSDGRSFEAVVVHSRTRMAHDVTYPDPFWDPETQQQVMALRDEHNTDEADVWGLQLVHARPLADSWQIGWTVTANLTTSPGVPRYDAPRDGVADIEAGRAEGGALNLGVGIAGVAGGIRLGADLVYEPIRNRIWGEDATGTTIENRIRYSNVIVRSGAAHEWQLGGAIDAADLRFGLAARLVDYRLAQFDHRLDAGRDAHDRWLEWMPTWGGGLHFGDTELRYHGSVLNGTERPRDASTFPRCIDICIQPLGPGPWPGNRLEPRPVSVVSHQLFVSVPVGGAR